MCGSLITVLATASPCRDVSSSMKIAFTNARSAVNKLDEIRYWIRCHDVNVFGVCESWFHPDISDDMVHIPEFALYRSDRAHGRGGGVAFYVHVSLIVSSAVRFIDDSCSAEALQLSITQSGSAIITLCIVYRAPGAISFALIDFLKNIPKCHKFFIFGDFNMHSYNSALSSIATYDKYTMSLCNLLYDEMLLIQHVHFDTRFSAESSSKIDLLFTRLEYDISSIDKEPPISSSDHVVVKFLIPTNSTGSDSVEIVEKRVRKVIPDNEIIEYAKRISFVSNDGDVESMWQSIKSGVIQVLDEFAPMRVFSKRKRSDKPPWFDSELKRCIRLRNKAWSLCSKSDALYSEYKLIRNKCNRLKSKKRYLYENDVAMSLGHTPKRFWNYVCRSRVSNSSVRRIHIGNELVEDPMKISEAFADVFALSLNRDDAYKVNICNGSSICQSPYIIITMEEVEIELSRLAKCVSAGPDDIPTYILKLLKCILSYPLSKLFNVSLNTSIIPNDWKSAIVVPLPKTKNACDVSDFRPISLTSTVSKVLERIVHKRLINVLGSINYLSDSQHGFRHGRSCLTNTLCAREQWADAISCGLVVDVVYLDFSKAFDRVPHAELISILESIGVDYYLTRWIENFLSGRQFCVRVGNAFSSKRSVIRGVPQGTVLGPLLFCIFINELLRSLNVPHLAYADDLKLWNVISTERDCLSLQRDLDLVYEWSLTTGVSLNLEKCKNMRLGRGRKGCHTYFIGVKELEIVSTHRDLGILIDSSLKTRHHYNIQLGKARKMMHTIKNCFLKINPSSFRVLFNSLLRPILEYCSPSCFPCTRTELNAVDGVLRRITRLCPDCKYLPYRERLKVIGIFDMKVRLMFIDLVATWKLLHKFDGYPRNIMACRNNRSRRHHSMTIFKQHTGKLSPVTRLSRRVVNVWNSLPEYVVASTTLTLFKKRLRICLEQIDNMEKLSYP